jgi:hypothetical protein
VSTTGNGRREASDDEATIDEALRLMKPTPHVTEEVKAALATGLPGVSGSVTEIAQMSPLRLASRLMSLKGVAEDDDLMDVARELIASFKAMLGLDSAPSQPTGPLNVTVALEKRLGELTPRELLTRLAGDPGQFDDIAAALRATRLARQAGQDLWVIPGDGGGIDVARTVEYLEYLSRPGSIPQRLWPPRGGTRPATLEAIFGRETRLVLNPFTSQAFSGFDEWGNDWNALPETVHLAMLWAAAAGHRNLPPVPDARRLTDDLFAERRPAYLREIIEDFEEARRRDPQLAGMTRYFTEETAAGLSAGQARPRRTEDDYRKLLLGAAQGHKDVMSGGIRLGPVVIRSFEAMSGGAVLDGTIVLGNSSDMSGGLRGTAYVPHGVSISAMSGRDDLTVYVRSYAGLTSQAGLA